MRRLVSTIAIATLAACGGLDAGYPGDFGATPGGVKDLHLARDLIARGLVPPAAALPVEGMFAEHDLGLAGPPCPDTLCLRGGLGIAPGADGVPRGWVQVGLSSTIDPATYVRPATTFIYTVDVSGSMGWDSGAGTPGELSRRLLRGLAPRLTARDQAAIVTYGSSVTTALAPIAGDQQLTIQRAIDRLGEGGVTDMEAGLARAYELGRAARAAGRGNVRIVLFTDVQPNVGATTPSQFDRIVTDGATAGVSLTVVALGLGIGPEVLQSIADQRGGNAFGLITAADVDTFLADEDPWFAAPIANALRVGVRTAPGVGIDAPYGFPVGFAEDPTMKVESVFLSKRKGALLVALAGDDLTGLTAQLELTYLDPAGVQHGGAIPLARGDATLDDRGQWFEQEATARTTALALITTAMRDAADAYATSHAEADAILRPALARFEADAAALAAPDLPVEVDLAQDLLRLIELGAPQGTLYGQSL
ncbi:MAG: VWA domain-containing protein [Myxococcales bacterium]|nr:VWA domain-containing protein [Myxococcales bacterium]